MKIICASKSPRRQSLLKDAGLNFIVDAIETDESRQGDIPPKKLVETLAERKAEAVCSKRGKREDEIIIAADTLVFCGGRVLGKPDCFESAFEILSFLSGKEQSVLTGVCIIRGEKKKVFCEESIVVFRSLSEEEIAKYILEEKPFDKAGAYAVQEGGGHFVSRIDGDYDNIVGLPIAKVISVLDEEFYDVQ